MTRHAPSVAALATIAGLTIAATSLAAQQTEKTQKNVRDGVFTVVCRYAPAPVQQLRERLNLGEAADRGAEIAGAPRKGLSQLRRVNIAVVRVPKGARKVIENHERVLGADLLGREHFVFHCVGSRH